jgi:DNA polymerase III epsilon subunit-like protein
MNTRKSSKNNTSNLFNHHHALADAEACAWIAMKIL